jgi:uncharacterized protein YkwD
VHHSPARAPLSERLAGSLTRFLDLARRFLLLVRRSPRLRGGRLALGALVSTVVTALVLSVPVVSGAGGRVPLVALDSFASTSATRSTDGNSPVVMGRDGRPVSSATFAGVSTAPAEAGDSPTDAFAGPASAAPVTTGSAPVDPPAPADSPRPADAASSAAETGPETTTTTPPVVAEAPAPQAPAPAAVPADLDAEDLVLALVNAERAAAGCGALSGDAALASVARAHSADMRDREFFDHVNLDGLDPFDRAAQAGLSARAENIAYGQQDAAAVMDAWMNSPGHRANILDCSLTRLGVGMADGSGGPWWTQLFA